MHYLASCSRNFCCAVVLFPIELGRPPKTYVDGGLPYNNPVRALYDEAKHVWGFSRREIGCIVSIGTGVPALVATGDGGKSILQSLISIATNTQQTADDFADDMEHLRETEPIEYFRLNVEQGVQQVKLEEWESFKELSGATDDYLKTRKREIRNFVNAILALRGM